MNRQEKEFIVDELKNDLLSSQASFLIVYKGLNVKKLHQLRSKLRAKDGLFKVAKARLMRRAVDVEAGFEDLSDFFREQIGLVFAKKDVASVAKVLSDFAKENSDMQLVAGYFDSKVLKKEKIIQIASLPSREILLAQLCATLNAPMSRLARVINMIAAKGQES
jgi:large subunit ribosomal protein L10